MAKSKNHTNHNQNRKAHRNGIPRPKKSVYKQMSLKGVDPKVSSNKVFLNWRFNFLIHTDLRTFLRIDLSLWRTYAGVQLLIQFLILEEVVMWRICIPVHFRSSRISLRMITWHLTVRKIDFDTPSNCSNRIISVFSNSLKSRDHYLEEEFSWIKSELVCICVTWLPHPKLGTGSKVGPPCR